MSSAPAEVRARHVLVKHKDVRRPVDPAGNAVTRTLDEALELLLGYREAVLEGRESFERVAELHSDCSSGKRGGDLGSFGRGMMQKPFEDAAFALDVGEISDVVTTDSGVHFIERLA